MLKLVPPVGNPIIRVHGGSFPEFQGYEIHWLASGTAALAMAMLSARRTKAAVRNPEVVIPGYACPDLIAAAIFAGLRPVLADVGEEDPGFNLKALREAITSRTVAVVAVNFLGIAERLADLRQILGGSGGPCLIEDDAQWYPEPACDLIGDYVCLSFGRGKPVSLLGGGALLYRINEDGGAAPMGVGSNHAPGRSRGNWEILAHNALLNPLAFRLLSLLPGVGVGKTRLEPIQEICTFPPSRFSLLPANIARHLARSIHIQARLKEQLENVPGVISLPAKLEERTGRLLRFPVLLRSHSQRERALRKLRSAGIGATRMYAEPLPRISGVSVLVSHGALSGASSFANRLLTLPVHDGVRDHHVDVISQVLRQLD